MAAPKCLWNMRHGKANGHSQYCLALAMSRNCGSRSRASRVVSPTTQSRRVSNTARRSICASGHMVGEMQKCRMAHRAASSSTSRKQWQMRVPGSGSWFEWDHWLRLQIPRWTCATSTGAKWRVRRSEERKWAQELKYYHLSQRQLGVHHEENRHITSP